MTTTAADESNHARARHLRREARAALGSFGLPSRAPMRRLHDGENTTYKVWPRKGGRPRVLRLHRIGYHSRAKIESEMLWLDALHADGLRCAPRPFAGKDRRYTQAITQPGRVVRHATLLTWTDGRRPSWPPTRGQCTAMGGLAAQLHRHAQTWSVPRSFRRGRMDAEGLVGDRCVWGVNPLSIPDLRTPQRDLLRGVARDLRARFTELGTGRQRFGVVHGDLHIGNVLVRNQRAYAIDFDDCARSWFLFDPAVALLAVACHPEAQPLWDPLEAAFWGGYDEGAGGPIPSADRHHLQALMLARCISMLAWNHTRAALPALRALMPRRIRIALAAARAYRRTGGARIH